MQLLYCFAGLRLGLGLTHRVTLLHSAALPAARCLPSPRGLSTTALASLKVDKGTRNRDQQKRAAKARSALAGRKKPGGRRQKLDATELEAIQKVRELRKSLHQPAPPPLRMARNRYLRHWTIHRAWQLYRRRLHAERHEELYRMWIGMQRACEVLRKTAGPGNYLPGHLFRAAMDRRGVYGDDGIPMEYSRYQTETPGIEPWDYSWTR